MSLIDSNFLHSENDFDICFKNAFQNQFSHSINEEDSQISNDKLYFNNNIKDTTESGNGKNKNDNSEQKKEKIVLFTNIGVTKIQIKDKNYKKSQEYQKENTVKTAISTESSTQLNKDKNTEIKNDSNENINTKLENIIIKGENKENEINPNNNNNLNDELINNNSNNNGINNIDIPKENNKINENINLNKKKQRNKNNAPKIIKNIRISVLNAIIRFINKKIKIDLNNKIGQGIYIKQFMKINKSCLSRSKVDFDKEFLKKSLKIILSWDISPKYTNYLRSHNKELIEYLINEVQGKNYNEIFDLSFLDCIEYIRGTKYINILKGLETIDDIIKIDEQNMDKDEIDTYKTLFLNYEDILKDKNSRNRGPK